MMYNKDTKNERKERKMEVKVAFDRIQTCYNRILVVTTTASRKRNYEEIEAIMRECPQMSEYWALTNELYYKDRVRKLKEWVNPQITYSKPKIEGEVDFWDLFIQDYNSCAYIVYLKDLDTIKVGKTNSLNSRLSALRRDYGRVEPLHIFKFEDEEDAYIMEVVLHKYYKKFYPNSNFVPQDRFVNAGLTEKDICILENSAREIREKIWF